MASAFVFAPPALVSVPLTGNVEPIDARPGRKERQMNPDTDHPRRRSGVSSVLPLLALVALGAAAAPASAGVCTFSGPALTAVVNFGIVNIPRDKPVNSLISQVSALLNVSCPPASSTDNKNGDAYTIISNSAPGLQADSSNKSYWATPIPGVALYVWVQNVDGSERGELSTQNTGYTISHFPTSSATTMKTLIFNYQLVKTALTTGSGSLTMGPLLRLASRDFTDNSTLAGPQSMTTSLTGTMVVPTCSTQNVSVDLKPISPSALPAVGSVAGSTPFNIVLQCPAGPPVNVGTTLTDATTPGNRTSTLSLAKSSSATGVAVQIRNTKGLVLYGPDSPVARNPNQFKVGTLSAQGGAINIPLTAEYVRTGAVTPGTVVALATFTMTYQ